jgi:hypothetical protein
MKPCDDLRGDDTNIIISPQKLVALCVLNPSKLLVSPSAVVFLSLRKNVFQLPVGDDIISRGEFNQLPDYDVQERTGFMQVVCQPTQGSSCLDQIYMSHPLYHTVSVVTSDVKRDHQTVSYSIFGRQRKRR